MAQQEIVIVGADGAEHVFPPGFDPKKAAAIVRQQEGPKIGPAPAPQSRVFGRPVTPEMHALLESEPRLDMPLGLGPPRLVDLTSRAVAAAARLPGVIGRASDAVGPAMKEALVEHGAGAVGLPPILAKPITAAAKALRGGATPPALPRGAPTPPGAPGAPGSAARPPAGMSPQRLRNEVGLAAGRQKVKLSEQEYAVAEGMVKQGIAPADAVRTVAQQIAKPANAAKMRLNVEESKLYSQLRGKGQTHQQASEAIVTLRQMAKTMGTPSTATVESAVARRNVTGRWEK